MVSVTLKVGALTGTVVEVPCVSFVWSSETISLAVDMTGVLSLVVELKLAFRLVDGGLGRLTGRLKDASGFSFLREQAKGMTRTLIC